MLPRSRVGPGRAADRIDVKVTRIQPGRRHIDPVADSREPEARAAPEAQETPGMPDIVTQVPGGGRDIHTTLRRLGLVYYPGAMKLDFQCVTTHWNWSFMASWRGPYSWIVMLLAPVWHESGFLARGVSVSAVGKAARS
jgi:hypothetical protein